MYPIIDDLADLADHDVSSEQLRRMAAKQLELWQEKYDEISDLCEKAYNNWNTINTMKNRARQMLSSATIYLEMVEELTRVDD